MLRICFGQSQSIPFVNLNFDRSLVIHINQIVVCQINMSVKRRTWQRYFCYETSRPSRVLRYFWHPDGNKRCVSAAATSFDAT